MTNAQQFTPDWFSMPGESVRSLMQRRGIAAGQLAEHLPGGMSALRGVLDASRRIDRELAESLAAALGGTADFWIKRQAHYDAALDRAVGGVGEGEAEQWLRSVPSPGAKPQGKLTAARKQFELRRRLSFFNVNNLRAWERRYGGLRSETRFRTSDSFTSEDGAVALWLRQGELEADIAATRAWNPDRLRGSVPEIRNLSKIGKPARFLPKLRAICAEAGVALVVVRAPRGCRASGASRLVSPDKAMVLLSFRYRADDQFWFTLFHELGHLVLHDGRSFVDDDDIAACNDDEEQEANDFASSCIVPAARQSEFKHLSADRDSIIRFSVSIGVAPGLTVGQMQHRQMIGHERFNYLKRRWTWSEIEPALTNL